MAFVPGYLHDVFISYACADDSDGLIRGFHELLCASLGALGLRVKTPENPNAPVDVFLDRRRLDSGDDLTEQVMTSARSTAVFIAFHSPAYKASSWCPKEAREFAGNYDPKRSRLAGRFFVVSLGTDARPEQSNVEAMRSRRYRRFYYVHPDGGDFPFDPSNETQVNSDGYTLKQEAHELARKIAKTLGEMKDETAMPRVFIADTSRKEQAEDMKQWLQQRQVVVMRASNADETRALLPTADIFVDLYEPSPLPFAVEQSALAAEYKKARVRWLPRGELSDEDSRALLGESELIEETLEDFKEALLGRLRKPKLMDVPGEAPAAAPAAGAPIHRVLIIGADRDKALVKQLHQSLGAIGFRRDAFVAEDSVGKAREWVAELTDVLKANGELAGVVFVDGECAAGWRDKALRNLYVLAQDRIPGAKTAVCIFPPDNKEDRFYEVAPPDWHVFKHDEVETLKKIL